MKKLIMLAILAACDKGTGGADGRRRPDADVALEAAFAEMRAEAAREREEAPAQAEASREAEAYLAKLEADRRVRNSQWDYWEKRDEMTDKITLLASADTAEPLVFDSPYGGPQYPHITIRHQGRKLDAVLRLERGQFMCSSWNGCAISVRFDDGPVERYRASGSADHDSTVLFINNAGKFYNKARKASKFIIEAMVYHEGSPRFRFSPGPVLATDNRPKQPSR